MPLTSQCSVGQALGTLEAVFGGGCEVTLTSQGSLGRRPLGTLEASFGGRHQVLLISLGSLEGDKQQDPAAQRVAGSWLMPWKGMFCQY